jgi:hypothetical protein
MTNGRFIDEITALQNEQGQLVYLLDEVEDALINTVPIIFAGRSF